MTVLRELGPRLRHVVGPLAAAVALLYLGYHAVNGERGLTAWLRVGDEVRGLRTELAELEHERGRLAHEVSLLRPESLDRDLLDERARAMLNLADPDDLVILLRPRAPAPGLGG